MFGTFASSFISAKIFVVYLHLISWLKAFSRMILNLFSYILQVHFWVWRTCVAPNEALGGGVFISFLHLHSFYQHSLFYYHYQAKTCRRELQQRLRWEFYIVLKGQVDVPLMFFYSCVLILTMWWCGLLHSWINVLVLYIRVYSKHICSAALYEATSGHIAESQRKLCCLTGNSRVERSSMWPICYGVD